MSNNKALPLQGLRVLDIGSWVAGPAAATIMGDFGAEVVKIEPPGVGDTYRYLKMLPGTPQCEDDYGWILASRNKRSLAIDVKKKEGYDALLRLVAQADVVVTNYRPALLDKLKLTYEELAPHNSRLIFAHLTGYGKNGDEINVPAYDRTTWWARSGLMDSMRPGGEAPRNCALGLGDHSAALALYGAVMMALYQRERTGEGSEVHTSLVGTGAWNNGIALQAELSGARQPRLDGVEDLTHAFAIPYQTADDRWFTIWALDEEQCFTRMTGLVGLGSLQRDPMFIDADCRQANAGALSDKVAKAVVEKSWAHWKSVFDGAGVAYVIASSFEEVVSDSQMQANGVFPGIEGGDCQAERTIDSPLAMTGVDKLPPGPAPRLGEHSRAVLHDYGFSEQEANALFTGGVVE